MLYRIVTGDQSGLQIEVNKLTLDGWRPQGGIATLGPMKEMPEKTVFAQAMILPQPADFEHALVMRPLWRRLLQTNNPDAKLQLEDEKLHGRRWW